MRRRKADQHDFLPDARYGSDLVTHLVNIIMARGKKSTAQRTVYGALDQIKEQTGEEPIAVFQQALENIKPKVEVKSRRVGGATYQVPMEVAPERRITLAMRWIITASRARSGKSFSEKLAGELMDAAENQGASIRRREEAHKMAEANRAFSHFRM